MSILQDNPQGRADIAVLRVAEMIVRGPVEKCCNGLPLWDAGLGRVIEAVVVEHLPGKAIDPVEVARELGLVRRSRIAGNDERRRSPEVTMPARGRRRYVRP